MFLAKEITKFAIVGLLCTLVNYLVFYGLLNLLGTHYLISAALGFLTGLVLNYFLNLRWSFKYENADTKTVVKYFSVYIVSLVLSLLLLKLFVNVYNIAPESANIVTIGFTAVFNFLGIKLFAFKN